jgi:outer membrane protein TolC
MDTHHWVKRLLAVIALFIPLAVHAAPDLPLDEAIALAIQEQPLLQSLDYASASSREAAVASAQLPDPELTFGIANLPVTSNDALRLNRDDMTMSTIGIMQEMVPKAKREAEAGILQATAKQYQTEKTATIESIKRDVALAWLNVFEAQRKHDLYKQLLDEMEAERKVLLSGVSTGTSESSRILELETEVSMVRDKLLVTTRDTRTARAALARWIGPASERPLPAILPRALMQIATKDQIKEIENHPLMQNAYQAVAVAQNAAERAKAEQELDWSWAVMYGQRQAGLSDMVTFQVNVELPWDRPNRQDRLLAEKQLLVDRANKLTEDRKRELQAEFKCVLAEAEIAKAREREHQESLIPAAEARLKIAEAGYSAGKQNLAEVWTARRALIEVELEHWAILTDEQRAAVKLAYLLNPVSHNQEIQ